MYENLFRACLNPFFESVIKRRRTLHYRAELEASQWLPRKEIEALQWQRLKALLDHAYQRVPYWQDTFKAAGLQPKDITSYADFCQLPLLSREQIRANLPALVTTDHRQRLIQKNTGGSTGQPLSFYYDSLSYQHRVAISKRGYGWARCEDGRRQFHLWGLADHRKTWFTRLKTGLHRCILRHQYFNCLHFNDARKRECLTLMNRFRPNVIIAYPGALYQLARFIEDNGYQLTFTPDSIIAAAEKIFDEQRVVIERVFKAHAFNSYGSREFMLLAMECEARQGLHVSAENILLEVVDEDGSPVAPGQQGEIVITDLHNYAMPFIRYRIGDQAVQSAPDQDCCCGRGLPRIAEVTGRTLDIIRLPDGTEVPGEFFVRYIGRNPGVSQFRVTQLEIDRLLVELVVGDRFNGQILGAIKKNVAPVLGESVKVDYQLVDELTSTPTGKFRVTLSFIA